MKQFLDDNIHWFIGLWAVAIIIISSFGLRTSLINKAKLDRNYQRWDDFALSNPHVAVPHDEPSPKTKKP